MYNCLPMYHSVGGVVATGAVLVGGGSVVIREKFSARAILGRHRAVGIARCSSTSASCAATCVNAQPNPRETRASHQAVLRQRAAAGRVGGRSRAGFAFRKFSNSTRRPKATSRSTTSKAKPGAIGRMPSFLAHRFPAGAGEVRPRNAASRLRDARRVLHALRRRTRSARRSARSADEAANDRRPVRGLYQQGGFREEDPAQRVRAGRRLVSHRRPDAQGRQAASIYFVDRIGDTFRWKGENVSTSRGRGSDHDVSGRRRCDVSTASQFRALKAAPAWPPSSPTRRFDLAALAAATWTDRLPAYARPLFLRIRREIEVTATFKHKKSDLAREGYDPAIVTDEHLFQ